MIRTFTFISLLTLPVTLLAAPLDYLALERSASTLLCEREPNNCALFKEPVIEEDVGEVMTPFIVNDITLPFDALRDADQQAALLAANLYVKNTGEVAQLAEASYEIIEVETTPQRKVLPIKLFDIPAPVKILNPIIIDVPKD